MHPRAVAATAVGVLAGVALAFGLGNTGRFVGYAVLALAAVVILRLGRGGVLRRGGRTLGLRDLAPRAAVDPAALPDRSYWIPRGATLTALDGKQVVPVGSGDDQANGVAVGPDGKIVVAGYVAGAANDTSVVRLNPNGSPDTTATVANIPFIFGAQDTP